MLFKLRPQPPLDNVADLKKDPLVIWQDRDIHLPAAAGERFRSATLEDENCRGSRVGCDNLRPISYRLSLLNQELSPFLLGYSSLLGRCLRLVSYANGALPSLRLCPFHGGSSLPSLCCRIADNFVGALFCQTPAANNCRRGDVKRPGLSDLLSLTKTP